MKYMTPELFRLGNSDNYEEVEAADRAWQKATANYNRWLKAHRDEFPESVRRFLDEECLHDADYLLPSGVVSGPDDGRSVFVLLIRQKLTLYRLEYIVGSAPISARSELPDELCSRQTLWLYDEFGIDRRSGFSHSIFLSNGYVLDVKFSSFSYEKWPIVTSLDFNSFAHAPSAVSHAV